MCQGAKCQRHAHLQWLHQLFFQAADRILRNLEANKIRWDHAAYDLSQFDTQVCRGDTNQVFSCENIKWKIHVQVISHPDLDASIGRRSVVRWFRALRNRLLLLAPQMLTQQGQVGNMKMFSEHLRLLKHCFVDVHHEKESQNRKKQKKLFGKIHQISTLWATSWQIHPK